MPLNVALILGSFVLGAGSAAFALGTAYFGAAYGESLWLERDGGAALSIQRPRDEQARMRITPDGVILWSKGHAAEPGPFPLSAGLQLIEQQDGITRAVLEVNSKLDGGLTLDSAEGAMHVHVTMAVQDCYVRFINETAGAMSVFFEIPILGAPCE